MNGRAFLAIAGLSGAISVASDAVARHALAHDAYRMELAAISARYGLIHAAVLVGVAILCRRDDAGFCLRLGGWLFVAGLVLFCGVLDAIAAGGPTGLAVLAPWGGGAFIAGWVALFIGAVAPRRAG